jgi:molecular chaperone HtpG
MGHLNEYDGKKFQDISRGELDLGKLDEGDDKKNQEKKEKKFEDLVSRIKGLLGERVKDVRLTHRLTDSPACLAIDDNDMGMQMRKIMEASGQAVPESKPIFEINPDHPLVVKLDSEADEELFEDIVAVLLGQANLSDGGELDDPGEFSAKLNKLLLKIN